MVLRRSSDAVALNGPETGAMSGDGLALHEVRQSFGGLIAADGLRVRFRQGIWW